MYYPFGYYGYRGYFDWTYLLVIFGMLLTLAAQGYIKRTYQYYNQIRNRRGLTGEQAAKAVMQSGGFSLPIYNVEGVLSDHYDPRKKAVFLSGQAGQNTSIAAVAVAAHECGHAIQDNIRYTPMRIRHAIVPICNICSGLAFPIIMLGVFISSFSFLIQVGILMFSAALIFQLITLPVEFDASIRAIRTLKSRQLLDDDELAGAKKVLTAAALTYVAGTAATALQFLRLLLIFGGRNRD